MSEHLPEHEIRPVQGEADSVDALDPGGDDPGDMGAHGGNMATGESHP
jgi:hypothetical protein